MIETLVMDAPLLLILWLANMAEDRRYPEVPHMGRGFAIASYVILGLIHLLLLLAGLLMLVVAPFSAEASDFNFPLLVVGMCVPSFVGLLFFIPFVRRLLSRIIPIDSENPVHTVSLSLSMLILFSLLFTLGIGLAHIAKLGEQAGNAAVSLSELWAQDITWFLLSLIGVGWLSRRKWREALSRLGVVRPSARDIAFGLGIGLLLVVLAIGFEYGANFFGI